jgi:hypothetical protein
MSCYSLHTAKFGRTRKELEKLAGFYAKDPVAQQKSQQEVAAADERIAKLKQVRSCSAKKFLR